MTTSVIISSPKPNHENVKVCGEYLDTSGNFASIASEVVLTDGESTQLYVHGSMRVTITEVQKGPVVEPTPDPAPEPDSPAEAEAELEPVDPVPDSQR